MRLGVGLVGFTAIPSCRLSWRGGTAVGGCERLRGVLERVCRRCGLRCRAGQG